MVKTLKEFFEGHKHKKAINESVDIELKPHSNGTHYIVHKIHPSSGIQPDQLAVGEKISDTDVDDLRDAYKIKIHPEKKKIAEETLTEAKITSGWLERHIIGADAVKQNKTDGTHSIARGFFYRQGKTSEGHAKNISDQLHKLGVEHDVVSHDTQDYKPFKGGASVWRQNHHAVTVRIHPGQTVAKDEE